MGASRPRLAVTLGDPRGIGWEVVDQALRTPVDADVILVGPDDLVASVAPHRVPRTSAVRSVGIGPWDSESGAGASADRQGLAGRLAGRAVERGVGLVLAGEADALVTAPVEKAALNAAGYRYPGLTELLAHLAGDVDVAMMLAGPSLRVVLVTTHLALRDVPAAVTAERIGRVATVTRGGLACWFGLGTPRLALCALNPHAGDGGLFGDEDERILRPAAREAGLTGPLPADTVFVRALRGEFDAVLVPAHDVGMTAIKVAAFGQAVNVTLGLPFPRTAPDHGTAFDIAGKGLADASSMRRALETAVSMVAQGRGQAQR